MSVYFFIFSISFHFSYNVFLHQRNYFDTYVGLHNALAANYLAGIPRQGLKVDTYV